MAEGTFTYIKSKCTEWRRRTLLVELTVFIIFCSDWKKVQKSSTAVFHVARHIHKRSRPSHAWNLWLIVIPVELRAREVAAKLMGGCSMLQGGRMSRKVWSWMTEFVKTLRMKLSSAKQTESFINKLLEQPFCHYQTENIIHSSPLRHYIAPNIHKFLFAFWFCQPAMGRWE